MSLKAFLKLVEIKTKIASVFPFLIGTLFVYYRYGIIRPVNTAIFFSSMLLFDLTTTAINNYMDYKKATSEEYRRTKNIIGQENIPEWLVVTIILTMLASATVLGLILVTRTDWLVLIVGMILFGIGIFYTFGPIPFSRMPLGEIFSGLAMGFGILFLVVYVNAFDQGIANLYWNGASILLKMNLIRMLEIALVSIPSIFTISNLMLANNICDLEEDIKNNRFTLPYYIGKKNAIILFNVLYSAIFLALISAVMLGLLPKIMLLSLLIIYPVSRQVALFNQKQVKAETFDVSVKNLVMINGTICCLLFVSLIV
jgi:UbiA prenyltransferase family.